MNKYLVIYECDGELWNPRVETADQIFGRMDLADIYNLSIKAIHLIDGVFTTRCVFYGTWHNGKDPLRMEIKIMCPMTNEQRKPLDIGYGSDH